MERFAKIIGKKRLIFVVPVLTPRLSAYWANLVTPVPAAVAFPIIEGLKSETICEDDRITAMVPVEPVGFDEAVRVALEEVRLHEVETRWTNASLPRRDRGRHGLSSRPTSRSVMSSGSRATRRPGPCSTVSDASGGGVGWYYADLLWRVRGGIDRAIGGVGLRRGRRDPVDVFVGDAIDFWRVEDVIPGERLLLHAEMKVPGDAWLEFRVRPLGDGSDHSELIQTAYFRPTPFWGRLYWNLLYPIHRSDLPRHGRGIARAAERTSRRPSRAESLLDPKASASGGLVPSNGGNPADMDSLAFMRRGADERARLPGAGGDRRDWDSRVHTAASPGSDFPRRRTRSGEACATSRSLGATTMEADARDPGAMEKVVAAAVGMTGNLDGVVNCVGSILLNLPT